MLSSFNFSSSKMKTKLFCSSNLNLLGKPLAWNITTTLRSAAPSSLFFPISQISLSLSSNLQFSLLFSPFLMIWILLLHSFSSIPPIPNSTLFVIPAVFKFRDTE
ncbi:hypothetical protein RIF29_07168 [Crotalaria pallida]|uniref:Uncharacterized protein n=1 Tax=Crotalaria pallida TaxID=3830 RepID=A0AAN9PAP9_CROPI